MRLFWALIFSGLGTFAHASVETVPLSIAYFGPEDAVKQALELTPLTRITSALSDASVTVINDFRPPNAAVSEIRARITQGMGLVLLLGENLNEEALADLGLERIRITRADTAASIQAADSGSISFAPSINWRAAPQVYTRFLPSGVNVEPVATIGGVKDVQAVLAQTRLENSRIYLLSPHLGGDANKPFREWFYFSYLIYALAASAAGEQPLAYGSYPGSPVPHLSLQVSICVLLLLMLSSTLTAFFFVRRYSKRHPELIHQAVADRERFREYENSTDWEQVGFHRAIAGFMVSIVNFVWLWVVLSILVNTILFGVVLPSAQTRGALSLVWTFFQTVWLLLDWGTAVAGQKFLSQYRVKAPAEGMKFVQLYVWWQAITGTIQVGVIALIAIFIIPHSSLAYLSLYILMHVMVQFPGFGQVFDLVAFPGLQRFDYQQVLGVINCALLPVMQILVCSLFILWGRNHPIYGSMAGGLGLGVAGLAMIAVVFITGFFLYRRLGLAARVLFMAHFDRNTVKTALKFGLPVTASGLLFTGAYSLQVWLLSQLVLNYAEVQANFDVALNLGTGAFGAVLWWSPSMLSSHSEAFSHGKLRLCRYYLTVSIRWGTMLGFFLTGTLLAVGDRFILGSLGIQYERAAAWIVYLVIVWVIAPYIWVSNSTLVGIGKPHLQFVGMAIEQTTRVIIMFLLAARLQEWALIAAPMIALPLAGISNTFFIRKHLKAIEVNWWQTVIAPALSGVVIFFVLRGCGGLWWDGPGDRSCGVTMFIIGLFGALPVHFFLTGLFGGWDTNGLNEFRRAVPMSSIARPVARLFLRCTECGVRSSPLHNRFPVASYSDAMAEADELTKAKVSLEAY